MKRLLILIAGLAPAFFGQQPAPNKPKLVLAVVIDQFRYDYLLRFRADYKAGFARILERGAVFTDAHYEHLPTVTAVGHAAFLSGAPPSMSGIVDNEWYDRETGKRVTSVSDPSTQLLGGGPGKTGASPNRLIVSTIGDELKMAGKGVKVIGISIKDRSAILPAGRMGDGAYWFDDATGNWVSSTYYFKDLPQWVKDYNTSRPADKYLGGQARQADAKFYKSLEALPAGNELIEAMAEHAIAAEQLGKHPGTDVLTVSFSANDYAGHAKGPDSPEVREISIATDRILGKLLDYIDARIGAGNTLFVMTADHGVAPIPEVNVARRMPGGRIGEKELVAAVQNALTAKFGSGDWIVAHSGGAAYLNYDLMERKKLDPAAVEEVGAEAMRTVPHIFRVYTRSQIVGGRIPADRVSRDMSNGFFWKRSADIFAVPEPYYLIGDGQSGTSHHTPFNYDTHVPIIFMGAAIKPGRHNERVAVYDIAHTLAAILEIEEPSGSLGRILF